MPTLTFGGWAFGVLAADWINEALTLGRIFNYDHLGANTAESNARVAEMMNRVIDELLEMNPDFDKTFTTNFMPDATDYGDNTIAVPADMRGQDGLTIQFIDDSQGYRRGEHCYFIDRYGWDQLPLVWKNGTLKIRNPRYWTWDDTAENIMFAPYPSDTTCEIQLTYRAKAEVIPSPFLGSQLVGTVTTVEGSPTVSGTPDCDFQTSLATSTNVTIGTTPYALDTVDSDTQLTLDVDAAASASGQTIYNSRTVGEIPVRFKQVYALRLAAYLVENIKMQLFADLMNRFKIALREMQAEIAKQLAAQQAASNLEARPNQTFDASGLFNYQCV